MCCVVCVMVYGDTRIEQQTLSCQQMQLPLKLVVGPLAASKPMHCTELLCRAYIMLLLGCSCAQHCFCVLPEQSQWEGGAV